MLNVIKNIAPRTIRPSTNALPVAINNNATTVATNIDTAIRILSNVKVPFVAIIIYKNRNYLNVSDFCSFTAQ